MSESEDKNKLNIDVVTDVVCPWCYVGKRHLDIAISKLPHIDFEIRWRPFQLNPQMPKEGMDREQYMTKKFGEGAPTTAFYEDLENTGSALDINFQFQSIKFAPNTFDAHRLIYWASGGEAGDQTKLVTKLFEVYFEEGGDVGNQEVLIEVARSLGMKTDLVRELLADERDVDAIKEQLAVAGKMGITGVPCFIIENKYAVMGAQKPDVLVEAFEAAVGERIANSSAEEGKVCAS